MTDTIKSRNTSHGFFHEVQTNYGVGERDSPAIFDFAVKTLIERHKCTAEDARNFLDSRWGRHFADSLTFLNREDVNRALLEYAGPVQHTEQAENLAKWVAKELRAFATPRAREEMNSSLGH